MIKKYTDKPFLIDGAASSSAAQKLEVLVEGPTAEHESHFLTQPRIAVIAHPHPLMEGTMQNKVVHSLSRYYRLAGLLTVRFNFRGVGQSDGVYDAGEGEVDDFLAVCAWVKAEFPQAMLWAAGFSFGSFVALKAMIALQQADDGVRAGLLVAPPIARMAFAGCLHSAAPLVVVQGEADEVVSPQATYDWFAQLTGQKQLFRVPDTGHFFHRKLAALQDPVRQSLQC